LEDNIEWILNRKGREQSVKMAQDNYEFRAVTKTVMHLWDAENGSKFLTSNATGSFSRRIVWCVVG
jgi:hypothetical protein